MSWTDERIEQLRKLWENGMTASQIAEELGEVSRNAVIGKAHRLNLQSRPSPVKASDGVVAPVAEAEAVAASEPTPAPAPTAAPAVFTSEPSEPEFASEPSVEETAEPVAPAVPQLRSIGPGGFQRQGPGDQQPPITPAPPRRLVPARPSAEIANKTSLLDLNDKICKWPLGHPGEPDFHFCGKTINPGFPYCLDHCSVAYQAQLPRRDRRPPPPLPFGGPRVR